MPIITITCKAANMCLPIGQAFLLRASQSCAECDARVPCNEYAATQPACWPQGHNFIWCRAARLEGQAPRMTLQEAANTYGIRRPEACADCPERVRNNCNQLSGVAEDPLVIQHTAEALLGGE